MPSADSRSEIVVALAEEFLDRYRQGERPSLKEYVERHPELEADIREAFPAMAMMENIALADESVAAQTSRERERPEVLHQLGDYRIIREVGRGGMGVVYEAEQVSLGRHVALKVLPRKMLLDPKQRRRFEREAKAAAKLHHTNIVPVFGVGEQDGLPYYVMQFIQGLGVDEVLAEVKRLRLGGSATITERPARGDLSAAAMARSLVTGTFDPVEESSEPRSPSAPLRPSEPPALAGGVCDASPPADAGGSLSASWSLSGSSISLPGQTDVAGRTRSGRKPTYWQSVAQIGLQVAEALEYAHRQGILHRDIKPSNLLLDMRGIVWVTDFGLAKTDEQDNLTNTGDILGTLRYMPPEAFAGRSDARADVYALGLTLYELLALRPAFVEKDKNRLIKMVADEEPARLGKFNPAIPRDLRTIIHKAIEKDPGHRYGSAGQLADDLRRFVEDEPIHARTISVPERAWRWCRRNPAMAGMIAAVILVTVGGFAANTYQAAVARENARRADANALKADASAAEAETNAAKAVASAADAKARADEAEERRLELEDANERLRLNQEQQRRNTYVNQLNLVPPTATAENYPQVQNLLAKSRPLAGQDDLRGWEWSYWMRQMHPEVTATRLKIDAALANNLSGNQLNFSPDLDPALLEQLMSSQFGGGSTWYMSDDGSRVAMAVNGQVGLWDAKDGRQLLPKPIVGPSNSTSTPAPLPANNAASAKTGQGESNPPNPSATPVKSPATGSKTAGKQADAKMPAPQPAPNKAGSKGNQDKQATAKDKSKAKGGQFSPPDGFQSPFATARSGALSRDGRRFAEVASTRGRGKAGANPPPQRPATLTVHELDGAREPYIESITTPANVFLNSIFAFDAEASRLAVALNVSTGVAARTCELAIFDLNARQPVVRKAIEGFSYIGFVAFLPDKQRILVCGEAPLPAPQPNRGAVFTPQPPRARTAIIDAQTIAVLSDVKMAANTYVDAVSPDGTRLAVQAEIQLPAGARGGRIGGGQVFGPAPELKILDFASGQELRTIPVPDGIENVCFSADGKRLAGVTPLSWIVRVWDVESGQALYTFRGQPTRINRIAFTLDGTRLVSVDALGTVKTWDLTTDPERVPMPFQTTVRGQSGPDGTSFTTFPGFDVARDGRRSIETLGKTNRGGGAQGGRGRATYTSSVTVRDEQGRVLSQSEHPTTAPFAGARGGRSGRGTAFSPDGSKFALYLPPPPAAGAPPPGEAQARPVSRWEIRSATGQKISELEWPKGRSADAEGLGFARGGFGGPNIATLAKFSPDGRWLAVVNGAPANRAVLVFNAQTGKSEAEIPATEFNPTNLAFSPDSWLLAIAGTNPNPATIGSVISVVDLVEGSEWARFTLPRRTLAALSFSPNGRWLAGYSNAITGFGRGSSIGGLPDVCVWDTTSEATEPQVLTGHTSAILDLAFTPDGNRLASLGLTNAGRSEIKVWDPATGQELVTLTEPGRLSAVRFSADGHKLYVFDGEVRRAYDATPLPPAIESLDVVDHLVPAETKAELDAQIDKLKLSPELKARVTELARPSPALAGGRGGRGGGPGEGFAFNSPVTAMFRPDLNEEDYRRALQTSELNIDRQGQSGHWLLRQGGALYRLGRYDEAIVALQKARDDGGLSVNLMAVPSAFLAMTYHRKGQAAKAKAELERMYKELKDEPPTFTSPANIYREVLLETEKLVAGKSSRTIEAIPLSPMEGPEFDRRGSVTTVANAMYGPGQDEALYKAALATAEQFKSASPTIGTYWLRYGGSLYRLGRYQEAIEPLVKARELSGLAPNATAAPSAFLAMTYHRIGQAEKAKGELARMYQDLPNARFNSPANFYRLFYIEVETLVAGKSSGTIEAMPISGGREGFSSGFSTTTGAYLPGLTQADYQAVWEAAQSLKTSTPDRGLVWLRSGGALYRLGRYKEALEELNKARQIGNLIPPAIPAPSAFLAMTYYRMGQTDKAKEELTRLRRELKEEPFASARVSPTYQQFYAEAEAVVEGKVIGEGGFGGPGTGARELGGQGVRPSEYMVIYRANRPKEEYERVLPQLEADKNVGTTTTQWYRYGGLLYRLGRYDEALKALVRAAEIAPRSTITTPYPSQFLAMTYHKLGRFDEAKAALAKMRASLASAEWASRLPSLHPDIQACFAEAEALVDPKK